MLIENINAEITPWFWEKKMDQLGERQAHSIQTGYGLMMRQETERAVLIEAATETGPITFWCPKSCLEAR